MKPRPPMLSRRLRVVDLGKDVPWQLALERQEACAVERRKVSHAVAQETLFLLEHAPVYTLGRNAGDGHVLWDAEMRRIRGVDLVRTSRGGDVTYHGPGQLVGYPIFMIGREPTRILPYIMALEEVLLRAVASLGVRAGRDGRNRGIWVGNAKLAALGVRVTGSVTLHGFALNVDTDFDLWQGIVPCGIADGEVTSLSRLLKKTPSMPVVKEAVVAAFREVFEFTA